MNRLSYVVALVLLVGSWAQMPMQQTMCDSPESEEAAMVARDYLNEQHRHGYKYEINRIKDSKIFSRVSKEVESDAPHYKIPITILLGPGNCSITRFARQK